MEEAEAEEKTEWFIVSVESQEKTGSTTRRKVVRSHTPRQHPGTSSGYELISRPASDRPTILPPSPSLLGSTMGGRSRRRRPESAKVAVKLKTRISPFRPRVVSDYQRSVSTRSSLHGTDRIKRLGVSPRVMRHMYLARSRRKDLEEMRIRVKEATIVTKKLSEYSNEDTLGSLTLY